MEKIEKLKEITGNEKVGFLEEDIDIDFDGNQYDEIMQKVFDTEYYEGAEDEKPIFSDDEEMLNGYYDEGRILSTQSMIASTGEKFGWKNFTYFLC